jgi:acyl carrier protein phosphodiesterase
MKIKVGSTYICDGADRAANKWMGPLGNLRRDVQELTQTEPLLRSATSFIADRQNLINTLSLTVIKHHSTIAAAWVTVLTTASLAGTITYEYDSTSKTQTGIARLVSIQTQGLAVTAQWQIIGGAIS